MSYATITRDIHERMFGGGVQPSLKANRPGTGRRAGRKIALLCVLSALMMLFLVGCSGGGSTNEKDQQDTDYEAQAAIEKQLEETALPKGYSALLEDDFITVLCTDGEATVTITASANFAIPYVAEVFLPTAQEAAEAAGVTLARFDVNSYVKMKDGIAEDTWSSWQTKDGKTGTLTDDTEGEAIVKQGLTIEQLYEYYADYKEIVNTLISEAGGGNE